MTFTINWDLLDQAREDSGVTTESIEDQIGYVPPENIDEVLADGVNTVDASLDNPLLTDGGGMGAFGEDITLSDEEVQAIADGTWESNDLVSEDIRPDYVKNQETYEDRQAAYQWYLENDYSPNTGYKLSEAERTELMHRLEGGGGYSADRQQWEIQQKLDSMTPEEIAQNPDLYQSLYKANIDIDNSLTQSAFDAGNKDLTMAVNLSMLAGGIVAGGALGTQIGAATGGGALSTGAIEGVTSSILTSGLTGQDIDIKDLITSGVLGAITAGADVLRDGTAVDLANSDVLGSVDDYVQSVSDLINVDYDTALSIMEGVATGVVTGADIEDIVVGAVGSWSTDQAMSWVKETYGDTFEVDNWFADGSSTIDSEAFRPFVETTIKNGLNGEGMDTKDAVKMAYGYFQNGGDLDFMFPEMPEGGSFFDNLNLNYDFATPEFIKDLGNTIQEAGEWTYENVVKPAGDVITDAADVVNEEVVQPIYENVVKPAGDVVTDAADWVNEEVIQPGYEVVKDVGHAIDDNIIDPIDEAIRDIDLPTFDTPELDTPDINLDTPDINLDTPDINLDLPSFNFDFGGGGSNEGQELEASGLFAYDPWKAVKPRKVADVQNYINRGLFS